MLKQNKKWKNEKGMALIIALLVTSALVVVGSFSMVITNTELDIAKNDRFGKEAFFIADAGTPISTKILSDMILNEGIDYSEFEDKGKYKDFDYDDIDYYLLNEVRNYHDPALEQDLNDKLVDSPDNMPDITATVSNKNVTIDVDWRYRMSGFGSSLLFAMGYEGVGVDRSHGGVKTYYDIEAKGKVFKNIVAEIGSVYVAQ